MNASLDMPKTNSGRVAGVAIVIFVAVEWFALLGAPLFLHALGGIGLVSATALLARLVGPGFLGVARPFPEALLAVAWVMWALASISAAGPSARIFVFLLMFAPMLACTAAAWALLRTLTAPTLQSLATASVGVVSLVIFLELFLRLGI